MISVHDLVFISSHLLITSIKFVMNCTVKDAEFFICGIIAKVKPYFAIHIMSEFAF